MAGLIINYRKKVLTMKQLKIGTKNELRTVKKANRTK